jgi:hypothetical protein
MAVNLADLQSRIENTLADYPERSCTSGELLKQMRLAIRGIGLKNSKSTSSLATIILMCLVEYCVINSINLQECLDQLLYIPTHDYVRDNMVQDLHGFILHSAQ